MLELKEARVAVCVAPSIAHALDRLASREHLTRSSFIRRELTKIVECKAAVAAVTQGAG